MSDKQSWFSVVNDSGKKNPLIAFIGVCTYVVAVVLLVKFLYLVYFWLLGDMIFSIVATLITCAIAIAYLGEKNF